MVGVVETMAKGNLTQTPTRGDPTVAGEVIQPHYQKMKQVNQHQLREGGVGECADDPSTSFFNYLDTALNFTNMFPRRRKIQVDVRDVITNLFKLVIH
jgi:hypothetical protein